MTVSYTHLDVYKRQPKPFPIEQQLATNVEANLMSVLPQVLDHELNAVSYTHLSRSFQYLMRSPARGR